LIFEDNARYNKYGIISKFLSYPNIMARRIIFGEILIENKRYVIRSEENEKDLLFTDSIVAADLGLHQRRFVKLMVQICGCRQELFPSLPERLEG